MKKVCKKLLSLVLVAVLLATAIPFQALAGQTGYALTVTVNVYDDTNTNQIGTVTGTIENVVDVNFDWTTISQITTDYTADGYDISHWGYAGEQHQTGHQIKLTDDTSISVRLIQKAPSHVHDWEETDRTDATCTTDGLINKSCSCGAKTTEPITKLDHAFGEWVVTQEATTTTTGLKARTCTRTGCGYTATESIPKLTVNTYTVSFVNGGSTSTQYLAEGASISFTNPGDTNNTYFKYWSDGKNIYTAGTSITCHGSATYTAMYGQKAEYVFKSGKDSGTTTYVYATPGTSVSSPEPAAWSGMTFKGWYTAASGGTQVNFPLTAGAEGSSATYYAQYYETNKEPNDVYLDVYIKGSLWTRSKRLNLTASSGNYIANDGTISIAENGDVRNLIKSYYTATNSDGIKYDGLYELTGNHPKNYYTDSNKVTTVNGLDEIRANGEKVYFVVLENVKLKSSSSSTADTTNPKTGDSIYMAVTVLGLSVASLAAVYYISKKRAVR